MIGAAGTMTPTRRSTYSDPSRPAGRSAGATVIRKLTALHHSQSSRLLFDFDAATDRLPPRQAVRHTNTTFATVFRLDGSGTDIPGNTPQRVTNGTHTIQVDLTATKSPGIFPAGNYQAQVTVRCE